MKNRKIMALLLAGTMVASLVGCGNTSEVSNNEGGTASKVEGEVKKEKVVAWCWDQAFNGKALEIAEEIYAKEHPNFELEIVDMDKIALEQKLTTNLVSGITDSLPDIILVNDPNIQKYITSYPDTFAALNDKVDFSQFSPFKVDVLTIDENIYGVPFDIGVTGTFYRRDYLEQAGFTEADLQNITWDRYIEIGKAVKEKTGHYMSTINPNEEALLSIILQSAGSWYITEDNKGNFINNPAMEETMRVYKAIADSGMAKPVTGWSEFVGSFNAGEVATVVSGVWQIASIMEEESQSGKWGVAPIPRLDIEGGTNASNEGGSSWAVLDKSGNKELAIDFLSSTIGGSTEFYERFLQECGGVGSYIPAFSSEAYSQTAEFFGNQPIYKDFTRWSTQIPGISLGMYTQEAKDALKNELPNLLNTGDITGTLERAQKLFEQQIQ